MTALIRNNRCSSEASWGSLSRCSALGPVIRIVQFQISSSKGGRGAMTQGMLCRVTAVIPCNKCRDCRTSRSLQLVLVGRLGVIALLRREVKPQFAGVNCPTIYRSNNCSDSFSGPSLRSCQLSGHPHWYRCSSCSLHIGLNGLSRSAHRVTPLSLVHRKTLRRAS